MALAVAAAFIWGATFIFTDLALRETPPLLFAALRFVAASLFVFAIPRPPVGWRALIGCGLLLGVGQYGFLFVSMVNGITPGLASLLVHFQAFLTIAIAAVLFRERPTVRQIVGVALAISGLLLLVLGVGGAISPMGLVLVLSAALCGAFGNNLLKALGPVSMVGVATWMSLAAPVPLFVLSALFEGPLTLGTVATSIASGPTFIAVVYSAILATVVAFAIWGHLFARYAAAQVAPFLLLVPVFGIGLSAVFIGETMTAGRAAGCALIFMGLLVVLVPPGFLSADRTG